MSIPLKVRFIAACFGLSCCSVGAALVSRGTLRVRQPPVPTLYELIDHFIIVPERNLLFCYIEKVGCSNFNELFRRLRARYDPTQMEGGCWNKNDYLQHNLTAADLASMLVNHTWHKAVFYRDPVERFVSAFASKCEQADRDGPKHCRKQFQNKSIEFGDATQWIANQVAKGSSDEEHFDVHWKSMHNFCGGLMATLAHYDTVEELEISTSNEKVSKLLQAVGVDPQSIEGFGDLFPPTGGKKALADSGSGSTDPHITDTEDNMAQYFPPAEAEQRLHALTSYYMQDYALFGMPVPETLRSSHTNFTIGQAHWPLLEFLS